MKSIYFAIFSSHMTYGCQVWVQNTVHTRQISNLQDKAMRIINFKPHDTDCNPLYKENEILKLQDFIRTAYLYMTFKRIYFPTASKVITLSRTKQKFKPGTLSWAVSLYQTGTQPPMVSTQLLTSQYSIGIT